MAKIIRISLAGALLGLMVSSVPGVILLSMNEAINGQPQEENRKKRLRDEIEPLTWMAGIIVVGGTLVGGSYGFVRARNLRANESTHS